MARLLEKPFNVGDRVQMWRSYERELNPQIWVVTKVEEAGIRSQSGWIVSVEIRERGHDTIRVVDHDSDWFVKVKK